MKKFLPHEKFLGQALASTNGGAGVGGGGGHQELIW